MLTRPASFGNPVFYPTDLDSLKVVFVELCNEAGIPPDSEDALDIASVLVRNFQHGITDEGMLRMAIRNHRLTQVR